MKYLNKILIIYCFLLVLCACKKDSYEPEVSDIPCLLTRVTTVHPQGNLIQNFEYDKYRRLQKYYYTGNMVYSVVEYNAQGRPSFIKHMVDDEIVMITKYNWDNRFLYITSEATQNNSQKIVNKLDYEFDANDQLIKIQRYDNGTGSWEKSTTSTFEWKDGNMISYKGYNSFGEETASSSFEYDANPAAYTSIDKSILFFREYLSKNNVNQYIHYIDGVLMNKGNYTYIYNEKGFPIKATWMEEGNDSVLGPQFLFEYDCLE